MDGDVRGDFVLFGGGGRERAGSEDLDEERASRDKDVEELFVLERVLCLDVADEAELEHSLAQSNSSCTPMAVPDDAVEVLGRLEPGHSVCPHKA